MLRDHAAAVDLFAMVPALELRFEPELADWIGSSRTIRCSCRFVFGKI